MTDRRARRSNKIFSATGVACALWLPADALAQPAPDIPASAAQPAPRTYPQLVAQTYSPPAPYAPRTYPQLVAQTYSPPGQYAPQTYPQPAPYAPQTYPQPAQGSATYTPLFNSNDRGILADRAQTWPLLRISAGAGSGFVDAAALSRRSFDFDVALGARVALTRRLLAVFEAGYSFASERRIGGHFATLGAGLEFYGNRYVSVGWTPELVLGSTWRDFAIGVRNTLNVPLFFHIVTIELGHQYLRENAEHHELRAQIGLDLAAIGYFWAWSLAASSR